MGFFDFLRRPLSAMPPMIASPYAPEPDLGKLIVADLYPDLPTALTRESALKVPAVKRAHDIVCGVLARMPWRLYDGDTEVDEQPRWLLSSASGLPPRDLRWGVASDLFMCGWAAIGFKLVGGLPDDALHLPYGTWTLEDNGTVTATHEDIPTRYLQRIIPIRLGYGSNGMLFDGYDTIADARSIEAAYRDRIENPVALTILSLAAERWDGWSPEERQTFLNTWKTNRSGKGGATALKPDWVTVDMPGQLPTDLFESGRNANRLDIANHAGLPAALVEGAKQSGGGDIHYSSEAGGAQRNELWDFGIAKYADAIESRLSLDDVCEKGLSIRVDASNYLTATPVEPQTSED